MGLMGGAIMGEGLVGGSNNLAAHVAHRMRSAGLDSLVRLLLGVDCIQPSLINVLFEKLLEFMDNPTGTRYVHVCE